jgi:c-di-GMP-related signal transduction protein
MTIADKKAQDRRTSRVVSISSKRDFGFPDYAMELDAALSGPVVDLEQVIRILRTVPQLGAQLLIFTNSEVVGLSHCVLDIPEAVVLLGTERLRALVLGYAVMQEIAAPRADRAIRSIREDQLSPFPGIDVRHNLTYH